MIATNMNMKGPVNINLSGDIVDWSQ